MRVPRARIEAILCDLDGTLLDTAPDIAAAVNAMLHELGRAPIAEEIVAQYVGQGVDILLHRVLTGRRDGRVDDEQLQGAHAAFDPAYAAFNGRYAHIYPGVVEGLDRFTVFGLRLACVTNKPQGAAEAILEQFNLIRYFGIVIGGDALPQRKPAPEPLWHAAELLGAFPHACLVLGDSANDAKAARAAGMPIVLVDYGYTEGLPIGCIDCDAVIASFTRLADGLDDPPSTTGGMPWIASSAATEKAGDAS